MRILTVNAGSSSLKVDLVIDGEIAASYDDFPDAMPAVDAVGHRIVHGGADLVDPIVIDGDVERRITELTVLAPLHQPKSLDTLARARHALPLVPHVACFDTAFHATMPATAYTYALPREWQTRWGVRRYGFHGLSHAWAGRKAQELVPSARRIVTCHLGAGASLCAVLDGRSIDTTMGFTPLDGLVMATRSGSVDPGLLLWLEEQEGLTPRALATALEHQSGLLALAGTSDMRELLERNDDAATLAVGVYLHRLAGEIAAMTSSLGGLDALVFTGGVGENASRLRQAACRQLQFLGVRLDDYADATARPDADVTAPGSAVSVLVVVARESLEIARGVTEALSRD